MSAAPEKAVEAPKAAEKEVVKAAEPEKDEPAPANKLTPAETQAADDLSIGADPSGEVVDMEVFGQLLEIVSLAVSVSSVAGGARGAGRGR